MEHKTLRFRGSDVHVYEFDPAKNPSQVCIGKAGQLEKVKDIGHSWYEKKGYQPAARMNLGFFDPNNQKVDQIGIRWNDGGFCTVQTNNRGMEFYLRSDDLRLIVEEVDPDKADSMKDGISWGGSGSYALMIDGKKNFSMSENFAHYKYRHPRSMVAQKKNRITGMITVDGRGIGSKIKPGLSSAGMTAQDQYELLVYLGYDVGVNVDGGGSTEMVIHDETVNNPSDGSSRSVGSILSVFEKITAAGAPPSDAPGSYDYTLDPGHGGPDPGGGSNIKWKGSGGWLEKNIVLDFALQLRDRLQDHGLRIFMTRTEDEGLDSKTRTDLIKEAGAPECISIHVNSIDGDPDGGPDASGYEAIHSIYSSGVLAQRLAGEIRATGMTFRRVFSRKGSNGLDYYFMHRLTGKVETVISELGFADSHTDVQLIRELWDDLVEAHAKVLVENKGKKYVSPAIPAPPASKDPEGYPEDLAEYKQTAIEWLYGQGYLSGDSWKKQPEDPLPLWAMGVVLQRMQENVVQDMVKQLKKEIDLHEE